MGSMKTMLVAAVLGLAACGGSAIEKRCDSLESCGGFLLADPSVGCPNGTGMMFSSSTTIEYPSGKQTTQTAYYCEPSCDVDRDCVAGAVCWHSPEGGMCIPHG
jgi:hypothetical protein